MAGKVQADLTGKVYNDWKVLSYLGRSEYKCKCLTCGFERKINGYFLQNNSIPQCNHSKKTITDLTDQTFGDWKVLSEVHRQFTKDENGKKIKRKWNCECTCGEVREVLQESLTNGKSTGCGHATNRQFDNLKGLTFGEWEALEYDAKQLKWKCKCSCGKEGYLTGYALKNGLSKSCGHNTTGLKDLTGETFGDWEVLRKSPIQMEGYSGGVMWECQCSCGAIMDVGSYILRNGISKSCGCKTNELREKTSIDKYGVKHPSQAKTTRTQEQLEMIYTKEKLIETIKTRFKEKPSIYELSILLGVARGTTKNILAKYSLEELVVYGIQPSSGYENWLNGLFPCDNRSDRKLLDGKEVDLYYPESKFAIEFNGNYWHSELKKDVKYHQEKTIAAAKKRVQLFHIFEYEWNNEITRDKIIKLINRKLHPEELKVIHARKCTVQEIESSIANKFIDNHHLQGKANAKINIGLIYDSELVGVMTFDRPRFNTEFEYELIRLAFKDNVTIVGGAARMFKWFTENYRPTNIITYCDISKFTGNIYPKLGFVAERITEPNYKWVNIETNETISRYQSTKQKLLGKGLGEYGKTEKEIMQNLGFLRVYYSGNLRLSWKREGENILNVY